MDEERVADCPCGSGGRYDDCCGAIHRGLRPAATAEQLMRSRYSAFAVGDAGWLSASWHPSTRPRRIHLRAERWTRLDVVATDGGGLLDQTGTVEFVAHHDGGIVHESSRFQRDEAGAWTYVGPNV